MGPSLRGSGRLSCLGVRTWKSLLVILLVPIVCIAMDAQTLTLTRSRFIFSRQAQQGVDGFYYQPAGLCEDYPEETTTAEKIEGDFDVLRRTGTKLLRVGIGWDAIEEQPGRYNWRFWDSMVQAAEREGVTLLPYVCYTPKWAAQKKSDFWREPPRNLDRFGDFMFAIARRYRGKVKAWELWNEPDNRDYWRGSAKQYATMFAHAARSVRRADSNAVIVMGGLTQPPTGPFWKAFVRSGAGAALDGINFHGYLETWDESAAEGYPARIKAWMGAAAALAPPRPDLWLAEFGYSDLRHAPVQGPGGISQIYEYEHTANFQAVALLRHHVLALSAQGLSLSAWFRIRDLPASEGVIGDDNNRHFGVLDMHGNAKPALQALRFWNALVDQPVRRLDVHEGADDKKVTQIYAFEKQNGAIVIAAWLRSSRKDEVIDQSGGATDERHETVSVALPDARPGTLRVYSALGEPVASRASYRKGVVSEIELTGGSIFMGELRPAQSPPEPNAPRTSDREKSVWISLDAGQTGF